MSGDRWNACRATWRSWLAFVALATYLVVAVVPFDRLVLCVQADGRVALEVAGLATSCLDCGRSAGGASDEDDCCSRSEEGRAGAPCRDVVVLDHADEPGVAPTQSSAPVAPPAALLATFIGVATIEVSIPRVERVRFEPPRPPPFELARVLRV